MQRAERLLVHVGRARAEDAAAGQRDFGAPESPQQRSAQIERRRELAHERVRRAMLVDVRRVDRDRVAVFERDARAERLEQRPHHRDVGDARDAVQRHFSARQQRGRHDRERGVLRALDLDAAFEPRAADDAQRGVEPVEDVHATLHPTSGSSGRVSLSCTPPVKIACNCCCPSTRDLHGERARPVDLAHPRACALGLPRVTRGVDVDEADVPVGIEAEDHGPAVGIRAHELRRPVGGLADERAEPHRGRRPAPAAGRSAGRRASAEAWAGVPTPAGRPPCSRHASRTGGRSRSGGAAARSDGPAAFRSSRT